MGTVRKAFAKPTLFIDESANAECCSYIRYDSNFIYHNIYMLGRLSLSQLLLTLKYSMQIGYCVHRKSHFYPTGKWFLQTHQTFLFVQLL
jgi:hypothetical protein